MYLCKPKEKGINERFSNTELHKKHYRKYA